MDEVERRYVARVMEAVGGNKSAAARIWASIASASIARSIAWESTRSNWHGGCSLWNDVMPPKDSRPSSPAFEAVRSARSLHVHRPPRILVAEDDEDMRTLVVEALRRDGSR